MRYIILTILLFGFFSCDEVFQCDNYEVLEGEMSLNGEILHPISGTIVTETEVFGEKVVSWTAKGVDESCDLNYTIIFNVSIPESDPIIGAFDFATYSSMVGQALYEFDENGNGGNTFEIIEGELVVTDETEGILTLDFDGFDENGKYVDLEMRYKFK